MSSMLHQLTSEASAMLWYEVYFSFLIFFFFKLRQKIVQLFTSLFVFNCHFCTTLGPLSRIFGFEVCV